MCLHWFTNYLGNWVGFPTIPSQVLVSFNPQLSKGKPSLQLPSPTHAKQSKCRILSGGDYWAERVDRHTVKWRLFLGGSCNDYLERVAQEYLQNIGNENAKKEAASRDKIQQEIESTIPFLNRFRRYEAEILQTDGVGQKLARANLISTEVGGLVWWLEDLLCQAMAGRISFEAKYTAGQLMYQLK